MGNKNKPLILKDDIDLFKRIAKHGFIDMEYVHLFVYKGKKRRTIEDRIYQLSKYQYLAIDRTFIPPDYAVSYRTGYRIITLGTAGIHYMNALGYPVIDNISSVRNASPYRKYHQVQVATVCDQLKEAYAQNESNWALHKVLNEREAYFEEIGNQPDAILLFRPKNDKKLYVAVFLEIERSYASPKAIDRKLQSYMQSFYVNFYREKLKIPIFENRLIFIAQTHAQYEALSEKIVSNQNSRKIQILLSDYQSVNKTPLDPIFQIPDDTITYKLLGKLPERKNEKNKF